MVNLANLPLKLIVLIVMLFGLLSLFIPAMPGLLVIWLAALAYGILTGFDWVSGGLFALITVLGITGSLADNVLMGTGARRVGASWLAIGLALAAGLLALIFWTPLGGLLAALAVLFLMEYSRRGDWRQAWDSTRSMALGCGWAAVIRILMAGVMIAVWLFWAFGR